MRFRTLLTAALLGGLVALAAPAHASVCYVGQQSEGSIQIDGKGTHPAGDVIEKCAGTVKAVGGKVDFCRLNKLGQFACIPLEAGDSEKVDEIPDKPQWLAVLQVLKEFVDPRPHRELGLKHLRDTGAPLEGLPDGAVLMPPEVLEFSGPRAGLKRIDELTVTREGGPAEPLFTNGRPSPMVEVPREILKPGDTYTWRLEDGAETFDGGFSVAREEDQRAFEEELAMLQGVGGSDLSTRNLVRAVLAKQYGYTYDMFLALEAARDTEAENETPAPIGEPKAVYSAAPDLESKP